MLSYVCSFRLANLLFICVVLASVLCVSSLSARQTENQKPKLDSLGDPLPLHAVKRFGTYRLMHPNVVFQVVLVDDDKTIISTSAAKLIAWEASTGKEIGSFKLPKERELMAAGYGLRPMAIVPNTDQVATVDSFGFTLWDWKTKATQAVGLEFNDNFKSIDVSHDGELVATGGPKALLVSDLEGKTIYQVQNGPTDPLANSNDRDRLKMGGDFSYARFSPDGQCLALVNSAKPKAIQMLKPSTGDVIREIETSDRVVRIDFSPDGKRIVATERDSSARLYDCESGERVWEFVIKLENEAESYTSDVLFRNDGKQIAVGAPIGSDSRIRLLDAETGKETGKLPQAGWKPWALCYTGDDKHLYSSGWDSMIRQWDVESYIEMPLPLGATRGSAACALSPDGKYIAYSSGKLQIVDLATDKRVREIEIHSSVVEVGQITFSYDGAQVAVGFAETDIVHTKVWDVATGKQLHHFQWDKGRHAHANTEGVKFSPDGKRLGVSDFRQNKARLLDLENGQEISTVGQSNVYGIDLNFDGTEMVTVGWDRHVRVWNGDTGDQIRALNVIQKDDDRGLDTRMYGVSFSPDRKIIATCDMTQKIRMYDRKLNPIQTIENAGWFTFGAMAFSRNGLWIASGSSFNNVRRITSVSIFDVATGEPTWRTEAHESYVYTVEFGARDETILSGGADGVCYLWGFDPTSTGPQQANEATAKADCKLLIGSNGKDAFDAYYRLKSNPELACQSLEQMLLSAAKLEVTEVQVKKWMAAFGSQNKEIIRKAQDKLLDLGPAVNDQMMILMNQEALPDVKKQLYSKTMSSIDRQYRRATILLAELETEKSDELIEELASICKSKCLEQLILESKKHRAKYLEIGK